MSFPVRSMTMAATSLAVTKLSSSSPAPLGVVALVVAPPYSAVLVGGLIVDVFVLHRDSCSRFGKGNPAFSQYQQPRPDRDGSPRIVSPLINDRGPHKPVLQVKFAGECGHPVHGIIVALRTAPSSNPKLKLRLLG